MTPGLRKLALTAHVTSTVGWLGAVAGFLALAIAGLTSRDARMLTAAYVAMDLTGWYVIVPLCLSSLLTGIVQALATPWRLFRHYWILVKLLIAILSTILLLLHMQATSRLAAAATEMVLSSPDLARLRMQLTADAVAALLALLVATTLAIYKPRGMTRYGARKEQQQADGAPRWAKMCGSDRSRPNRAEALYASWRPHPARQLAAFRRS